MPLGRCRWAVGKWPCVVVGFVELGVLAELEAEVIRVVYGKAGDDLAWAKVPSNRR